MDTAKHHSPPALLLRYGLPLVITVGLCWLLLRGIDLKQMGLTIRRDCDFRWIAADVALVILAQVARALRWRIQLRALGINAGVWPLTLSVFGTYAVNLVFPRLGEVWRTGYVAQRYRAPFATVFGSMVADRLTDTMAVGLIALGAFAVAGPQIHSYLNLNPRLGAQAAGLLTSPWLMGLGGALCAAAAAIYLHRRTNRLAAKAIDLWHSLWQGFAVITHMPGKGPWLVYTLIIWGAYFAGLGCAFAAFPLTCQVLALHGWTALLVCFVLTSLSMLVPSNGGIGPWQWAMIWGLGLYAAGVPGLTHVYMATFANLALGVQTLSSIILGLLTFTCIALQRQARHTYNPKT